MAGRSDGEPAAENDELLWNLWCSARVLAIDESINTVNAKDHLEFTSFVDTYSLEQEVFIMQRHRPPYPAEFRAQMIELVHAGRKPEELSKEFETTAQTIYNWVAQAEPGHGK